MKTDAIQLAIRSSKTGVEDRQAADDQLSAIVKRNTALEAENAKLRAALLHAEGWADRVSRAERMRSMVAGFVEDHGRLAVCPVDFEAALSPPTGKVLVYRETLVRLHYWISCAHWASEPQSSERGDLIRYLGGLLLKED